MANRIESKQQLISGNRTALGNAPTPVKDFNALVDAVNTADKGYKVYTALLSQSGTSAPTATVLANELSGIPAWTYSGVGEYIVTLSGAFTASKTMIILPQNYAGVNDATGRAIYSVGWNSVDDIYLNTGTTDSGGVSSPSNGFLGDPYSYIEIRVYNS
jgi:hypothetical protein